MDRVYGPGFRAGAHGRDFLGFRGACGLSIDLAFSTEAGPSASHSPRAPRDRGPVGTGPTDRPGLDSFCARRRRSFASARAKAPAWTDLVRVLLLTRLFLPAANKPEESPMRPVAGGGRGAGHGASGEGGRGGTSGGSARLRLVGGQGSATGNPASARISPVYRPAVLFKGPSLKAPTPPKPRAGARTPAPASLEGKAEATPPLATR